jgi:hypothetical protein
MTIFASLDEKKSSLETSALKFAVSVIEKILPTIEKERAEKYDALKIYCRQDTWSMVEILWALKKLI